MTISIVLQDCVYINKNSINNCSNCIHCEKKWIFKGYKCAVLLGSDLTNILKYGKCGMCEEK